MNDLLSMDNKKKVINTCASSQGAAAVDDLNDFYHLQLEGAEQEELEQQKLLAKRRRRSKIQDVLIDVDELF